MFKSKTLWIRVFAISATAFILAGCNTVFTNYTPERIPQNPSGIYTFSFLANPPVRSAISGSETAQIVINGETHEMQQDPENPRLFTFDFRIPQGITEVRYYYILHFDHVNNGQSRRTTRYSTHEEGKVFQGRLINRYPIQLVNERGPVGASIALVGSGFSSQDVVMVGGREATTTVHSGNSIEFTIPAVSSGRSHEVVLRSGAGDIPVGSLRVDSAQMRVQPGRLTIDSGSADLLIVQVENPAPRGGYEVDIRTDIPNSVIMPEVTIPEGARSVNVRVEGGEPGRGILSVNIPGFNTIEVPIEVR